MALRTDYQDFVANAAGKKYRIVDAGDGMVEIQDVTTYDQIGDSFSAGVINAITRQVNNNSQNIVAYSHIDNGDFTQFIAQAGIGGRHGTQAYAGDRWILDSGTVTGEENENGNGYKNITLNGSIRQKVANPPTVGTAFVEMVSGTATVSYSNGEVTVTSSGGVIKYVDLFEGEYTADNRPKRIAKGYAAEFAECQRCFRRIKSQEPFVFGSNTNRYYVVKFTSDMRTIPTISILSSTKENKSWSETGATFSYSMANTQMTRLTAAGNITIGYDVWAEIEIEASADW